MLIEPNITKEEFAGIGQAVTQLRQLLSQIQYMEPRDVAKEVDAAISKLENSGFTRVNADNDAAMSARDEYYAAVAQRQGFTTQWGIYAVEIDGFRYAPSAGCFWLKYTDENGKSYGPVQLDEDPSWLAMWRAADSLIVQSDEPEHKTIVEFKLEDGILNVKVDY